MTNIATDNIKALAKRYNTTPAAVRDTARDIALAVTYDAARRTWVVAEDAATVRLFNDHLAEDFIARIS